MYPNNDAAQTNRQSGETMSAPGLAKRSSPSDQSSERVADETVCKPSSGGAPRCTGVSPAQTFPAAEGRLGSSNARFTGSQGDGLSWEKANPFRFLAQLSPAEEKSARFWEALHERTVASTPTMARILQQVSLGDYPHCGIHQWGSAGASPPKLA